MFKLRLLLLWQFLVPKLSLGTGNCQLTSHQRLFWVILLVYGVAALLYAVLTPPWQAPDEPAHYNYIHYLAVENGFPELVPGCYDQTYLETLKSRHFPSELSIEPICYEFHQPPLYYLLATPLFNLSQGSLLALRLLSLFFGAGVITAAFLIGRTIFPTRPALVYGLTAFTAFIPMHVAILASANNDALAELILALLLLLLLRRLNTAGPVSARQDVFLGLLLGLGLLTKATVYNMIPLTAVALWLAESARPERINWGRLLKQGLLIYGLALLLITPWFARNVALYGGFDLLGLGRHDQVVVGQLRTAEYIGQVGPLTYLANFVTTTFHSFWGQFGWMAVPMNNRTYFLLALLTLAALGGLVAWGLGNFNQSAHGGFGNPPLEGTLEADHRLSPLQYRALIMMGFMILLVTLGYSWYNLTFVQFQGRYLFPGLIPLALFFTLGLTEALRRRWLWLLSGGLALGLVWAVIMTGQSSGPDKWTILIIGLALALVAGRHWAPRYEAIWTRWLLVACYMGIGFLTLAAPFWFVKPYL
jgi:4-amino-4-deoxy-L-arabinose transferase-like glycosyltransferase